MCMCKSEEKLTFGQEWLELQSKLMHVLPYLAGSYLYQFNGIFFVEGPIYVCEN